MAFFLCFSCSFQSFFLSLRYKVKIKKNMKKNQEIIGSVAILILLFVMTYFGIVICSILK